MRRTGKVREEARRATCAALLLLAVPAASCNDVLDIEMPGTITPDEIDGASGAALLWAGAIGNFARAFSSGGAVLTTTVGLFGDEFHHAGLFAADATLDLRAPADDNVQVTGLYRQLHVARVAAVNAAAALREFLPGDPRIAEMAALQGFTYVFFAEAFCSGVPYGSVDAQGRVTFGVQTNTTETLERAVARFDTALASPGITEDLRRLAAVGRARALVRLGNLAAARAAAAEVPTPWAYLVRSTGDGSPGQRNALWDATLTGRLSLSDGEGGTGVRFRTLDDPRVPWTRADGATGQDGVSPLYAQGRFPAWGADVPLATGVEARLIEAEVALVNGEPEAALRVLADLRATVDLPAPADPGTQEARLDLLFQERALWLFGTGHRLGDLRRLVRTYGRDPTDVFPSGAYFKGGDYGAAVTLPIPRVERENPNFTGCFDHGA